MDGLKMKYFILSPSSKDKKHAEASRKAMLAYANEIAAENPRLAKEIGEWVLKETPTGTLPAGCGCGYCDT